MKTKWKVTIAIFGVAVLAIGMIASVKLRQRGQVTVQTGMATRANLVAQVTASGEIKPRTYTNLGANAQGRIVELLVNEGDYVHKGQVVARIENIQATADVEAQRANVAATEADAASSEAGLKVQDDNIRTQEATVDRAKAQLELSKANFERYSQLWEAQLIAKQEYDQRKSDYEAQKASVREAELRLDQLKSQRAQTVASMAASQRRVAQAQAQLSRVTDILAKYDVIAPHDGVVTNLPVRVGETVVPGVQNSAASAVMTIADMSLITAEVKVDETDIVNLKLDQPTEITIDALPDQTFAGHVIEIGNTAILRSSGQVASNSATSSTEAKDFKVVVAMDNPPPTIRPGLSCTAKITTSTRDNVVAIPIQALTVRQRGDLEDSKMTEKEKKQGPIDLAAERVRREEVIGVFVVKDGTAEFRPVETGIAGSTDIEVTKGLDSGEQIIIGSYQVIRTIRPGVRVNIDNRSGVLLNEGQG